MSNFKTKPIRSKKARESARGEQCTLNIAGVCNYDPSTTVLAHLPDDSGTGKMAGKSSDFIAVFACSNCHDILDGRNGTLDEKDRLYYSLRGLKRTLARLFDKGALRYEGK